MRPVIVQEEETGRQLPRFVRLRGRGASNQSAQNVGQ